MTAREDYVGPMTKSAEAMFQRAERRAQGRAPKAASAARPPPGSSPIRQVLEEAGLTMAALRHWEMAGIIAFKRRSGLRLINEDGLRRLRAVIALRRAGLTVRQISWLSPDGCPSLAQLREALASCDAEIRPGQANRPAFASSFGHHAPAG